MCRNLEVRFVLILIAVLFFDIASSFHSLAFAQTCGGVFDPETFTGSPFQKVQAAIDAAAACGQQGGTVVLGKKYNLVADEMLRITTPNVHLHGPGSLLGMGTQSALIAIGPAPGQDVEPVDMDFVIDGVGFAFTSLANDRDGIILHNANRGRILNCRFEKVDRAIHVMAPHPSRQFHHVAKIIMTNNVFGTANYALKIDKLADTATWNTGDLHFTNNMAYGPIHRAHVNAEWIDGIVIANNTFFFSGFQHPTKESNIFIDHGNWLVIQGNNLFEAGTDAIDLRNVQNPNISGNNIAWPGQRIPGSGIRISEGDYGTLPAVLGAITGNNIMFPTLHGINIDAGTGHIAITGNQVFAPGDGQHYYGEVFGGPNLSSLPHYGVNSTDNVFVLAVGNLTSLGTHALDGTNSIGGYYSYYSKNLDAQINAAEINSVNVLGGGTTVDANRTSEVRITSAAPHTVSSIINGFDGQEITFVAYTGNTTLMPNPTIILRGGLPVTIPANGTITLRRSLLTWFETSRNF